MNYFPGFFKIYNYLFQRSHFLCELRRNTIADLHERHCAPTPLYVGSFLSIIVSGPPNNPASTVLLFCSVVEKTEASKGQAISSRLVMSSRAMIQYAIFLTPKPTSLALSSSITVIAFVLRCGGQVTSETRILSCNELAFLVRDRNVFYREHL